VFIGGFFRLRSLVLISGFIFLGLRASIAMGQGADAQTDQAVRLYETRHHDPANLDQSAKLLEQVLAGEPDNLRANCEYAHVCYLSGDATRAKSLKLRWHDRGVAVGRKAIELDENCADAHVWYVVNRGRQGQTKGVLNSLWMVPEIKREVKRILEIDPENTIALDVRAMLYYELPGFAGGDLKVSEQSLNQALAIDSSYALLYVDMGKVQIARKNYEKARWYLNRCLAIEPATYEADFVLDDKPDAERMLKEIGEK
jgi:tetratricopeptide (TPR) repeat protein